MAVLVDSSVWIAASSPKNKECMRLKKMIKENEAIFVTRPIQVEVCQGARSENEFQLLWDGFLGFEFLEITTRIWGTSAWNYFRCRKKGITLSTLDCLMATVAREYGVKLWTLDKNLLTSRSILGFDHHTG